MRLVVRISCGPINPSSDELHPSAAGAVDTAPLARVRELTFLDQGLSSLTNFGGSALAAGLLTASDFGAFAVASSVLILVLGVTRSWSGNSMMILAPAVDDPTYRRMLSGAFGLSLLFGFVASILVCAVGAVADGALREAMLTLALCIPFVTTQDALRLGALSRRDPRRACWNDAAWLVVAVAALMILRRTDTMSLPLAVVAATGSAAAGLCVGLRLQRVRPTVASVRTWTSSAKPTSVRMTADFIIALSYSAVPLVVITAWQADLAAAGSLRTAVVLLGPLSVVFAGSTLYMQPRFTAVRDDQKHVLQFARSQSFWNAIVAAGWTALALAVPDRVGVRVFGASWEDSTTPLLLLGIAFVAMAVPTGPLTAMRGCGWLNANLLTQASIGTCVLVGTAAGGLLTSDGMLRGFAAGHVIAAVIAWFVLARILKRRGTTRSVVLQA